MKKVFVKKLNIFVLILVLLGSLTGCGKTSETSAKADDKKSESSADSGSKSGELKTVRIGQAGAGEIFGGILGVAQQEGFLDEELKTVGFKPEYTGFAGAGPEVNEALASSKIDFASAGNLPPIVAKSNGVGVHVLNVLDSNLNMVFLTQPDSDIKGIEDLEGKTVLVGKGTILQYLFEVAVESYGLDINKIKVVNTVTDAQAAFLNGDVDVYATTDIQAELYAASGDGKIIFSTSQKPEWSSQQIFEGRDEFVDKNPEVAVAIEKAIIRAYEFAKENSEKAYEDFTLDGKYDLNLIKKVYSENNGDNGKFDFADSDIKEEDIKKLQDLSDFLYSHQTIGAKVDAKELVDTSYYEQALSELGK